ncbi:hypothetical protein [Phormidesmis priestleyi]|uniref:hypothetical protein n=1 Tax=Phormidesmis priestleyi TaxID=268141 RepID=UPI0009353799|nr:hypothetical protein [Phormidesmis priestleyi]
MRDLYEFKFNDRQQLSALESQVFLTNRENFPIMPGIERFSIQMGSVDANGHGSAMPLHRFLLYLT